MAAEADSVAEADAADTSTVILRIRTLIAAIWSLREGRGVCVSLAPRSRSLCYGVRAIGLLRALNNRLLRFVHAFCALRQDVCVIWKYRAIQACLESVSR